MEESVLAEKGKTKGVPGAKKRIMRLVRAGHQLVMVNIHIQVETNQSRSIEVEPQNSSEKSCEWFEEDKLLEIVDCLKPVMIKRINSSSKHYYRSKKLESVKDLTVRYSFKRRPFIPGQHFVTTKPESIFCSHGKKLKEKNVSYKSCLIFHETLEIEVNGFPTATKSENDQLNIVQSQKPVKENIEIQEAATSSYFNEQTDAFQTSSVKRKKTTLRKMAKKSRIALIEIPSYQKSSKSQALPVCQKGQLEAVEKTLSLDKNDGPGTESDVGGTTNRAMVTTVIDLERVPVGLKDVCKVEDLREDHLKFLINQMEGFLRTIFRGEVYCQRHEDYKKGGKYRDDLNFQVGMAHFSEDQHECILSSLVAMFCYRDSKYLDYVTKVMLPVALIKLYQNIHKTSFEEAEECLFNDTIRDND